MCVCVRRGIVHMLHCGSLTLMAVSFTLEKKMGQIEMKKIEKDINLLEQCETMTASRDVTESHCSQH